MLVMPQHVSQGGPFAAAVWRAATKIKGEADHAPSPLQQARNAVG